MSSESDNLRKMPADRRGAYEVWYTTWNHPATGQGFWLRFITESPTVEHGGPPRGELWFARFDPSDPQKTFGIHQHIPWEQVASTTTPMSITIGGSTFAHDHTRGVVTGNGHSIRWDLRWQPAPHTVKFLPDLLYARGGLAEHMVLSPNPRVALSGTLVVDGEELVFDRAPAGQSHVWGKKHAFSWVWAHCNDFAGESDVLFQLIGARLQRRGVMLPQAAMVTLRIGDEDLSIRQVRHAFRSKAEWRAGKVTFAAASLTTRIEGELTCRLEDMVNAPYVDPDGQGLWCANSCIGNARITVWRRSGVRWREHRRLDSRGRAHFEVGSRERDPAATTPHVLVT